MVDLSIGQLELSGQSTGHGNAFISNSSQISVPVGFMHISLVKVPTNHYLVYSVTTGNRTASSLSTFCMILNWLGNLHVTAQFMPLRNVQNKIAS